MNKILFSLALIVSIAVDAQSSAQPVTFTTSDSGTVVADYYPAGAVAVVLAHGAAFNKESWKELAKALNSKNISVLAIDFRGYGQSKSGNRPGDKYEDILAAVRFLHSQAGIQQVAVLGASMGGAAAAKAAVFAKTGEIERIILLSPVPISNPEKMKGDILYIASRDEVANQSITDQYNNAPEPKQLKLLDGRVHAQHIFKTPQKNQLIAIITEFLQPQ